MLWGCLLAFNATSVCVTLNYTTKKMGQETHGRKTIIICPVCGKKQTIQDMINKEIMGTPNEELSPRGLRLKEKLKTKPQRSMLLAYFA